MHNGPNQSNEMDAMRNHGGNQAVELNRKTRTRKIIRTISTRCARSSCLCIIQVAPEPEDDCTETRAFSFRSRFPSSLNFETTLLLTRPVFSVSTKLLSWTLS